MGPPAKTYRVARALFCTRAVNLRGFPPGVPTGWGRIIQRVFTGMTLRLQSGPHCMSHIYPSGARTQALNAAAYTRETFPLSGARLCHPSARARARHIIRAHSFDKQEGEVCLECFGEDVLGVSIIIFDPIKTSFHGLGHAFVPYAVCEQLSESLSNERI